MEGLFPVVVASAYGFTFGDVEIYTDLTFFSLEQFNIRRYHTFC